MEKVNIITMGCSKNLVDSEQLAAQLEANGYEVELDSEDFVADIVIVNTCGFINDAKEESIGIITELIEQKAQNKVKKLVVCGCLSARYYDELKQELPEVDLLCGNYNLDELLGFFGKTKVEEERFSRLQNADAKYAYLKIAEGCVRNCAFCAIPLFKGKYVSRPMDDIVAEAEHLVSTGVNELIIIAQDICFYGYDRERKFLLPQLIERLSEIEGLVWIRLHYLYPFLFPDGLIEVIRDNPKVCKYIDIPLQHISDNVLEGMHRGGTKKQTIDLLNRIRKEIPQAAIRTTLLVGFPNETESDFQELVDFVKEQKFDRLGVFQYSEEEGTAAASEFEDAVPPEVKAMRAEKIMEIQQEISYQSNLNKVGKTYLVHITDEVDGDFLGRTEFDSVEVDNEVYFPICDEYEVGDFVKVRIDSAGVYELYGEIVED
ncbi:MAG: 30S ribosomal protein S12 methylthiotransferase RimO [Bacteroidales bacterium]|nr:30S ribosomal protein S12 methylthiotransferase RimO [Bacteroidales bacterium]